MLTVRISVLRGGLHYRAFGDMHTLALRNNIIWGNTTTGGGNDISIDADGDTYVDLTDAILVLKVLAGETELGIIYKEADIDNGILDHVLDPL